MRVDPAQLESALANLATNARDAMPKGGRLSIATANRQLDDAYAAEHPDVAPGDYAMLQVSDTGSGMSRDVVAKVFEPFFTTKPRGRGTGLGLSMVFGFIKQSGGHINVYSEVGVGTTFRLYMPRLRAPAETAVGSIAVAMPRGNGERILVVEDEPAMRRVVVRQLDQLGYRTAEAENAAAALHVLEADGAFDLLFSDVVHGRQGGRVRPGAQCRRALAGHQDRHDVGLSRHQDLRRQRRDVPRAAVEQTLFAGGSRPDAASRAAPEGRRCRLNRPGS
ncbi:MAG: ATP-binding protein [Pseudomonadota bacterium]